MKEEKTFIFTRKVTGTEWGIVTATSEEEAKQKIINDDYDDIIENSVDFTGNEEDILEIKED